MPRHAPRWALVAAIAACGPGGKKVVAPPIDQPPVDSPPQLADIPTRLDVTNDDPMSRDAPGARSPLLDIMAAENARWMATLGKQPDPA